VKILHKSDAPAQFGDHEEGAVELAMCQVNEAQIVPFNHITFHYFPVGIRDLKLFGVDGLISLQVDVMPLCLGLVQADWLLAYDIVVAEEHLQILAPKWSWNSQFNCFFNKAVFGG
jgi:hypothetical protein